jgi:hypothetical protein
MLKLISTAALTIALAGVLAGPAIAQKPGDKLPVLVTGPDAGVIREAIDTVKAPGECTVEFVVGKDGKPKEMKPKCDNEAYLPFVERAMAKVLYQPEIFDGEIMDSEPKRQPFKFNVSAAPAAASQPGDKAPVVIKDIDSGDLQRAMENVDAPGSCNLTLTVGADGKAKDIMPNCTPDKYNRSITSAVKKMKFEPGQKGGNPIDWPNYKMPLSLGK